MDRRWIAASWIVHLACGPRAAMPDAVESSGTTQSNDDASTFATSVTTTSATTATTTGTTTIATSVGEASATATETTAGDEFGDNGGFLTAPDACFAGCLNAECDLWAQDCPRGEKCIAWSDDGGEQWDAPHCTPVARMPAQIGEPCVADAGGFGGIDDCALGSMCWNVDADGNGTCVAQCSGSDANPVCEAGVCFIAYEGWIDLCLPGCDPLAPVCDPGFACVESSAAGVFACIPAVLVADRSSFADPCDHIVGCGTGLRCVGPDDVPECAGDCCTALCDPNAPFACPDGELGQVCLADAEVPGLGYCGVP